MMYPTIGHDVVERPQDLTEHLTANLGTNIHPTAARIYRLLHSVTVEVAKAKGYHPKAAGVHFHVPAELVAFALEINRSTLYRHLPALREAGLVHQRAHYGASRGSTRATGSLWAVKLDPNRGKAARLNWEDYKHSWRDLDSDRERGRTAWLIMQQSEKPPTVEQALELILEWALPPQHPIPVTPDCRIDAEPFAGNGIHLVRDVQNAPKRGRAEIVNRAAIAVGVELGDDSVNFYRWLLWQLLRLRDRGEGHYFDQVQIMLERVRADRQEDFARRAGALFVSRLKKTDLWEVIRATPLTRVAYGPPQAQTPIGT